MDQMIADAERYRLEDVEQRKRATTRNELEYFCRDTKTSADTITHYSDNKRNLLEICVDTINWLDDDSLPTVEEMEAKKEEIQQLWNATMVILPDPSQESSE